MISAHPRSAEIRPPIPHPITHSKINNLSVVASAKSDHHSSIKPL
jgi:hypothetical protein